MSHPIPAPSNLQHAFLHDVQQNRHNRAILERWDALGLPEGWLVAGCLFQTVWNLQAGQPPEAHIKDYDLFYFEPADLSEAAERAVQARVDTVLADLGITLEVANQARVHLWYEDYFGEPYAPLQSSCEGIRRFLIPATCVGVRPGEVYAPNGLQLLYDGVLTPNPLLPYSQLFERKAASYCSRWPALTIDRSGYEPLPVDA
ncbi:nucleotidyltransferase family protein [Uliginosibacterium paludis]|uniref:Nucleotidyltransferase family protein n=1 Tax=Uliginosibacterium paludis TaxID=1615952 RepID=A0ABV2CRX4_9RHOO